MKKLKHIKTLEQFINENYSTRNDDLVYADFSIGGDMDNPDGTENPDYLEFTLSGELHTIVDHSYIVEEDDEYDYSVSNIQIENEEIYTAFEIARINEYIVENLDEVEQKLSEYSK